MRNRLTVLLICTVLCFFLAGRKTVDFVGGLFPPAQPGECLKLVSDGIPVKVVVLMNIDHRSYIYILNNGSMIELSFQELRELDAEKVSCK